MSWAAVIAAILGVLGPLVQEWLRKWLDDRLRRAAVTAGVASADIGRNSARLLQSVHDDLWWWQAGKRRFVAALIAHVPVALKAGHGLTAGEAEAIRLAAAAA